MRIGAYLFLRCRAMRALAFASACLAVWSIAPPAVGAEKSKPGGSFEIPAWAFDRGSNVVTLTSGYADAEAMVGNLRYPTGIEYDIDFPVAGEYALSIRYAAATARPVQLFLDAKDLPAACRTPTGGWKTSRAAWEKTCKLTITKGKHTLKLFSKRYFPHVVALRFECPLAFPAGWKLDRPGARKLPEPPTPATDVKIAALRLAIRDLAATFGTRYPKGGKYLERLHVLEARRKGVPAGDTGRLSQVDKDLVALRREALMANPLLDFDKLLLVRRGRSNLGLPRNWESNSSLAKRGYDNQIAVLSPVRSNGRLTTLYQGDNGEFVGDLDLHFDAGRMLFSMPGKKGRWQVFEIRADPSTGLRAGGTGVRQITGEQSDVDSYDACYLPDGKVLFTSTACYVGTPCVTGASHVAVLYVMDAKGKNIRQLCFDQEHNWCPTVLNNGRVLYSRWEYTDTPHSNSRLLFHMNPDGTGQVEYYGSNSYWPNSIFYARPVPGHSTRVAGVVGGHHDHPRMGELVIFDPSKGRFETDGVVQRIPGRGKKVQPVIADGLTRNSWPKFLHPYPLSAKYFLVSCKPTPRSLWGIYLVDVFDNMVLIKASPGKALLEPVPFRKIPTPPVIPDKVDLTRRDAEVHITDIYAGDGLKGVRRGVVKSLRLFTYHFAYHNLSGSMGVVGMDGPWDIKRVIGTVPMHEDGSARFLVPANTPIAIQPLDAQGKALQLMRSWMTAMPGEVVSCVGCHEKQNTTPPVKNKRTMAMRQPPAKIKPWYGPMRGFAYGREVQPVIDRHCVGCHNGRPRPDGSKIADLRGTARISDYRIHNGARMGGRFSVGYAELHRFVRRPGLESDYHLLKPMEFHADTTQLVQMLAKGHHNVRLDAEGWDRLITWIDLNCPYHGTWGEDVGNPGRQRGRRRELLKLYANVDDDAEAIPKPSNESRYSGAIKPILPKPMVETKGRKVECPGWPFDAAEARRRQQAAGSRSRRTIDLGSGVTMKMVLIPAGEFVMGSLSGGRDERAPHRVRIQQPFWMGVCEVSNRQYARFDPRHNSRVESTLSACHGVHGHPLNRPEQPVVRITWNEARAFCRWLSKRAGQRFSLPTEAQWEYAARAGTATPMYYGEVHADFSSFANMADARLSRLARDWYILDKPIRRPTKYDDWIPKERRFDDGAVLSIAPGRYRPNAWGLCDMHGNVAEWTQTRYMPYPYSPTDGREDATAEGRRVVRGGSWRDRPRRCTSSFRLGYRRYQPVYNVGFRVVLPAGADKPRQPASKP